MATADLAGTCSVIRITPVEKIYGLDVGNFKMDSLNATGGTWYHGVFTAPVAGVTTSGLHGIHIDLSGIAYNEDAWLIKPHFHDIVEHDERGPCFGGRFIYLTNPTVRDGFFSAIFQRIFCVDGMYFLRLGDSCVFRDIVLADNCEVPGYSGRHTGIVVYSMASGANMTVFDDIEAVGDGGLIMYSGDKIKITNCNMEMLLNSNSHPSTVYVDAATKLCILEHNNISAFTGTAANAFNIRTGDRTRLMGNNFWAADVGSAAAYIGAACTNTLIYSGNLWTKDGNISSTANLECHDTSVKFIGSTAGEV
jgi:hypothetical protein